MSLAMMMMRMIKMMMRVVKKIKMMITYLCFLFFYLTNLFLNLLFRLGKVEDKDDGGKEDGKEPAGGLYKSGESVAHRCTIFLCYLGCEMMINTEIQI